MPLLLSALASRLASTPSPAAARGSTRRSSRLPCPRAPAVPVTRSRGYSSTLPWMSSLLWMPPPQWMPLPIEAARARGPSRSYCRSPFARVAARAFGSILRARIAALLYVGQALFWMPPLHWMQLFSAVTRARGRDGRSRCSSLGRVVACATVSVLPDCSASLLLALLWMSPSCVSLWWRRPKRPRPIPSRT